MRARVPEKGRSSPDILIRVDLARHDHHPDEEYGPDDPEGEFGLPALTDIPLLQKCQRFDIRSTDAIVEYISIALVVDVWTGKELDRSTDDAGDEEDEQNEGEQHHDARKQFALCDVDDFNDDKDYRESADSHAIRHYPWRSEAHSILYRHELRVDAEDCSRCG